MEEKLRNYFTRMEDCLQRIGKFPRTASTTDIPGDEMWIKFGGDHVIGKGNTFVVALANLQANHSIKWMSMLDLKPK